MACSVTYIFGHTLEHLLPNLRQILSCCNDAIMTSSLYNNGSQATCDWQYLGGMATNPYSQSKQPHLEKTKNPSAWDVKTSKNIM